MSAETTNNPITDGMVGGSVEMLRFAILEGLGGQEPRAGTYDDVLDCGTMRVRLRIEVEPTGITREQAAAAAVAEDAAEPPEVRAAARLVAAGGEGLEEALAVLSRTGPWPGP